MKKFKLPYLLSVGIAAGAFLLASCIDHPDQPGPISPEPGTEHYDYATTNNIKLDVDYSMKGNKAQFEVYAENPVTEKDGALVKKQGVKALLKAYTDNDCRYSGSVALPTAAEKVWLYSDSYGLPTCIAAEVTESGVSVDLQAILASSDKAIAGKAAGTQALSTRAVSASNPFNIQQLGEWTWKGLPLYIKGETFDEDFFPIYANIPNGLMNGSQPQCRQRRPSDAGIRRRTRGLEQRHRLLLLRHEKSA